MIDVGIVGVGTYPGVLQLNKSKIPCRPHKACIFLSNFMFLSVLVCDSVL